LRKAEEVIDTDRLLLRAFRNSDHDAYAAICADPEVMRLAQEIDLLGGKSLVYAIER